MTATESLYQEEIALAKTLVRMPDVLGLQPRDDNPRAAIQLAEVRSACERVASELDALKDKERTLLAELLPDTERVRLAQMARDLRAPMTDYDDGVPATPCPEWCEHPEHGESRSGKYHQGAWLDFRTEQGGYAVMLSVSFDDGNPTVDIDCGGQLNVQEAQRLDEGLNRAISLCKQLHGRGMTMISKGTQPQR